MQFCSQFFTFLNFRTPLAQLQGEKRQYENRTRKMKSEIKKCQMKVCEKKHTEVDGSVMSVSLESIILKLRKRLKLSLFQKFKLNECKLKVHRKKCRRYLKNHSIRQNNSCSIPW